MENIIDNVEVESRMIEFNIVNSMSFNDLTDVDKAEIFGNSAMELNFNIEDTFDIYC